MAKKTEAKPAVDAVDTAAKGPTLEEARKALNSKTGRAGLPPRNDPYWGYKIDRGLFVGYRRMAHGGNWIARWRNDEGKQEYQPLGQVDEGDVGAYDEAKAAARAWLNKMKAGVRSKKVTTVANACREYVEDRRKVKGAATAKDAEQRFNRTVYSNAIGALPLDKVTTRALKNWRDGIAEADAQGKQLSRASLNRTLTALKAALNLAVHDRHVSAERVIEWRNVKPLDKASNRRELYLDRTQRRALLEKAQGPLRNLIEAAMLTGARPGELRDAKVRDFDARQGTIKFTGKTGARIVPLAPTAAQLFKQASVGKLPGAWLLDNHGGVWDRWDWNKQIQEAAQAAELPAGVCLYSCRHAHITEAIMSGMDSLMVAKMVGTSIQMIDKNYGHLSDTTARERMARIAFV